jgi:hypothetical protein
MPKLQVVVVGFSFNSMICPRYDRVMLSALRPRSCWPSFVRSGKYVRAANVPGMDDGIAAGKCRERLRPQQAMSIGNRANGSRHARSDVGHLVVLPSADGSSLSRRQSQRNSCPRGSALAAAPSAAQRNGQEKYLKSFDDIVDHCCYVWITLIDLSRGKSCPPRAAMVNREAVARRTLQWWPGGGRKNSRPSLPRRGGGPAVILCRIS